MRELAYPSTNWVSLSLSRLSGRVPRRKSRVPRSPRTERGRVKGDSPVYLCARLRDALGTPDWKSNQYQTTVVILLLFFSCSSTFPSLFSEFFPFIIFISGRHFYFLLVTASIRIWTIEFQREIVLRTRELQNKKVVSINCSAFGKLKKKMAETQIYFLFRIVFKKEKTSRGR